MKIAYVTDSYWPRINGLTVSVDAFSAALAKRGHQVHVLTNDYGMRGRDPGQGELSLAGRRIHRFKSTRVLVSPEDYQIKIRHYGVMMRRLADIDPDVVHVHTGEFAMGQLAKLYAKLHRKPLVMSSHTHWEHYIHEYIPWLPMPVARWAARLIMRMAYRTADRVIAPSVLHRELMASYHLSRAAMTVLPTGFDLDAFRIDPAERARIRAELHCRFPQLDEGRTLLYVGRIGKEKNVDLLIGVMERVVAACPQARLLVIGDGQYRKAFAHAVARRGLARHFCFLGYVDHWKIKYYYAEAEVFVFPSVSETQGMVTVEAMACGTPVVAVGEMGTFYVMGGDNGGFMVKNDAAVFAEKVCALLLDNDLRVEKSREAINFAQRWTIDEMVKRLLDLYSSVISK